MPWIDADLLLRRASAEDDDWWDDRWRTDAPRALRPAPEAVLSVSEVARRLGCTIERVRRMLRTGRLPFREATRKGCRVWLVVPEAAVLAFMANSPVYAASGAASSMAAGAAEGGLAL